MVDVVAMTILMVYYVYYSLFYYSLKLIMSSDVWKI